MTPALVIYLMERTIRWLWPSVRSADLVDVHLLPGKERVICLRVARPMSFHYSCAPTPADLPSLSQSAPACFVHGHHIRDQTMSHLFTDVQQRLEPTASPCCHTMVMNAEPSELDGPSPVNAADHLQTSCASLLQS